MPNWCNNSIEIVGPRDKIRAVWAAAQKEDSGLLNALRPQPENIFQGNLGEKERQECAEQGIPNWYDWNVSNWGTKWDVSLEGLEYEEDEDGNYDNGGKGPHARITGWFDSAWSPPMNACEQFCTDNPDVRITLDYHEPGMCFVGRAEYADGDLVDDTYYDYGEFTSKTVRAAIGEELDDFWAISENMAEWEEENEDA